MSIHTLVIEVEGRRYDDIEEAAIVLGMRYCGWGRKEAEDHFEEHATAEVRPLPREVKYARQRWAATIRWPV